MMKIRNILMVMCLLMGTMAGEAKSVKVPYLYMFGFSASFKDSVVYFTDVQDVQNAWIDKKTKFLLGRDNYSYQMKQYFTEHQVQDRVCMVFYATSRSKAEKQLQKMKKKYVADMQRGKKKPAVSYEVRYLSEQDFKFEAIDMSEE